MYELSSSLDLNEFDTVRLHYTDASALTDDGTASLLTGWSIKSESSRELGGTTHLS